MHQECDRKLTSEQLPRYAFIAELKQENANLLEELTELVLDVRYQLERDEINRLALHDAIDRAGRFLAGCGEWQWGADADAAA